MSNGAIRNISDTARWVAMYRAIESERPDAHFHDPYARRLAGERGEQILRSVPKGRAWGWPMVVRTCVFDELILRTTGQTGQDGARTVLNLACGLDVRPYRLPLPAGLRWIEVDLPEILDYKEEMLAGETPVCEVERVSLDLADRPARRAFFARVGALPGPTLVVSEGLLIYLGEDEVGALAADLAAERSFRWWLFDLISPELMPRIQKAWGATVAAGNAPFRFAPAAGVDFFRPFGWREKDFRPGFLESRRLRRESSMAWFWWLLYRLTPAARRERFHRLSGYELLERTAAV